MTVIAYDGKYLYSDSLAIGSNGNISIANNKIKKFKFSEHYNYIASAGRYRDILRIYSILNQVRWFDKTEYDFDVTFLLIDKNKQPKLYRFDSNELLVKDNLKLPIIFGSLAKEVKKVFKENNDILFSLKQVCGVNNPINIVKI